MNYKPKFDDATYAVTEILCFHNHYGGMFLMCVLWVLSVVLSALLYWLVGDPVLAFVAPIFAMGAVVALVAVLRSSHATLCVYYDRFLSLMCERNPDVMDKIKMPPPEAMVRIFRQLRVTHAGNGLIVLVAMSSVEMGYITLFGAADMSAKPILHVAGIGMCDIVVVALLLRFYLVKKEAHHLFDLFMEEADETALGLIKG